MTIKLPHFEMVSDAEADRLRRLMPAERLDEAFAIWTRTRDLLREQLQQAHPEWDLDQIAREAGRLLSLGITDFKDEPRHQTEAMP